MSFPEPQKKPTRTPNYQEKIKLGLIKGGLRKFSDKGLARQKAERDQHNKNIEEGVVYCVVCGSDYHIEKHHPFGRSKPDLYVYLCGEYGCKFHKWIHENANEAYKIGWIQPLYKGLPDNPNWPKPWENKQ